MKLPALQQGLRILAKYNSEAEIKLSVFGYIICTGVEQNLRKSDVVALNDLGWSYFDDSEGWGVHV